ncbi:MAG: hypothetical protein GOVbin1096_63 [Prokaryotic dsDNA virus sp.]|jgi:hypothetical protein|nr:MAG: hypothetical protein GOVbin1096_63 [Prokaryotic dsDNA virus sp.]|tara:strand:+ start:188 stop:523 length:336 start_codon:yes stop_codon:yes gene_type:complete
MAKRIVKLPLYNDINYTYSTVLEGNTYSLKFLYLERIHGWTLTLKDSNRNVLVAGQRLTPDTRLFESYRLPNLTGYFVFTTKSTEEPAEGTNSILKPKDFYDFYYVYEDGE